MLQLHRRSALVLAALLPFMSGISAARADAPTSITGPFTHDNLSVYLIHGPSASGPVPLTLAEAMAKHSVEVRETGSVNRLEIENLGTDEVFVQAGDIVKGGQQDRVLTVSLLLPAKSGKLPIDAFCVEQGRWTRRGIEDAHNFASSASALPSAKMRLAMQAPLAPVAAAPAMPVNPTASISQDTLRQLRGQPQAADETSSRQHEMWQNVAQAQQKLASALGGTVASPQSASSLQLALENDKVNTARAAYVNALTSEGEKGADVIGYAVAINGRLSSADVYPSNGLFRKMWQKQLAASATEALADKSEKAGGEAPTPASIQAFLSEAEQAKADQKPLTSGLTLATRDAPKAVVLETSRSDGVTLHKNYLVK